MLINGGGNVNFTNVRTRTLLTSAHCARSRMVSRTSRAHVQNIIIDDSTSDFDICVGAAKSWDWDYCNCSQPDSNDVAWSTHCLNACAHYGMCEGNGGTPGQNTRDYVPGAPWGAVSVIAYNTTSWNR